MSHIGYENEQARRAAEALTEPERDRYGRPLLVPPHGGGKIPYQRVSTLAKILDDQTALMSWKQRKTAEGLVRRPDLATRIAGALANGDPDTDYQTKRDLNQACEQAMEAAGASRGSSAGTGLHALTEALDRGNVPLFVPDGVQPRLDAYAAAMDGYEVLDIETFIVNDHVGAAGTFDRLVRNKATGRVRVADLKTGKSEADYPLATTIQIATYAYGCRYDVATDERSVLHPDLDVSTGLLIHLPPSGGCEVHELDLLKGWDAAKVAAEVREIRKLKRYDLLVTG